MKEEAQRLGVHRCLDKPLDVIEIRRIACEALETVQRQKAESTPPTLPCEQVIEQRMDKLRYDIGAYSALLITTSGQIIHAVGATAAVDIQTLSVLMASDFLAAHEIARLLGRESTFKVSYHESDEHNVYTYEVGDGYLLVVIFGQETRAGIVWFYARRAAEDLKGLISQAPMAAPPQAILGKDFETGLQNELDSLFTSR